jgi:hypothetical protein
LIEEPEAPKLIVEAMLCQGRRQRGEIVYCIK